MGLVGGEVVNDRAILFPGQGAQHVGMAAAIVTGVAAANETMLRANEVLGFDLLDLCLNGPAERLEATDICQPAIFAISAAVVEALRADGHAESFTATAGLSLGEYTALWFAGSLTFDDALRLVRRRGIAMQEASDATPSGMLSLVGASPDQAEQLAAAAAGDDVLVAANYLGPGQVVLSGALTAIDRAEQLARDHGIRRTVRLKVAGAFHSPLMASATTALSEALRDVAIRPPRIAFFTNVTGDEVRAPEQIRAHLAAQVVSPVRWEDSMNRLVAREIGVFVEPAPGRVLSGLMKKVAREARIVNLESQDDLQAYT